MSFPRIRRRFEALENRTLLDGGLTDALTRDGNALTINGSANDDEISVAYNPATERDISPAFISILESLFRFI